MASDQQQVAEIDRVVIRSPHVDLGTENTYHEWYHSHHEPRVGYDAEGRSPERMIHRVWQPWRCNNPDCTAEALVNEEWIADVLGGASDARALAVLDAYAPLAKSQRGCSDVCGCTDCEMVEDLRSALTQRVTSPGQDPS